MSVSKLTDRTELNATPADGDVLHVVDIDDTTGSAAGTSKKVTVLNLMSAASAAAGDKVTIPVRFAEAVSKGDPVYLSGYNTGQSRPEVLRADASDSAQMPSIGVADDNYAINTNGGVITIGSLEDLDTSSFAVGDVLYVASGGGLTATKPTGTNLIQNVGKVGRSNVNNGEIIVMAIGRSNDVPNIPDGQAWVGNGSGVATPTTLSNLATSETIQVNTTGTGSAGGFGEGSRVWRDGSTAVGAGGCYARSSSGWVVSNAASVATASTGLLAVASATNSGTGMVLEGIVQVAVDPGGSAGDVIYLSLSTGRFSTTPVGGVNEVSRVCGYKIGTNLIYFRPSQDWIEIS